MAKVNYKKNQEVYFLSASVYDGKASFSKMFVKSCGAKEMTLIRENGDMLGHKVYARDYNSRVFEVSKFESEKQAADAMLTQLQGELEDVRKTWAGYAADPSTRVCQERIKQMISHYAEVKIEIA